MKRRDFFTILGVAAVAAPFAGSAAILFPGNEGFTGFQFPELPYPYDALEPYIDAKTMEIHYTKHHRSYFDKFTAAINGTEANSLSIEKIFASVSKYPDALRNNGGGYFNHNLFWENMAPGKTEITEKLKGAIIRDFNSLEEFKNKFSTAAKTHFGSGWAWLISDSQGKLSVTTTANQDNPLMDIASMKGTPLLCLDVWEHAYYLKYQNKRADYVDNFWNVVNWETVSKRYLKVIG
jgi:superoxide dismutase, Fe-Mn family